MAENREIEHLVETVVSQVLETHLAQLRGELVRRVLQELGPVLQSQGPASVTSDANVSDLVKTMSLLQTGGSQKEILRALLDGTAGHCGRAALFVVKGGAANGWQGRGFANNESIKDFSLDVYSGAAAQAMQTRMPLTASPAEMDQSFGSHFGLPENGQIAMLPLLLKDKVAALVYADSGVDNGVPLDSASLELLVASASAWLEVASVRKQAQKESVEPGPSSRAEAPPVQTVSSFSDPFASHAPSHAPVHPAPLPPAAVGPSVPAAAHEVATATAAAVAEPPMSAEDADTHRKAQRFARLLVDEIKLYNQVKVAEGRKNKDLYDRMKEDIEKSRATYQKRYGSTVAAAVDYFNQELVRSLAEDDSTLMGANFHR